MALGTEQALVATVSGAAVLLGAVFAGLWYETNSAPTPGVEEVASPAPFNDPPFCKHLVTRTPGVHEIIVRIHSLAENPPAPMGGVTVNVNDGDVWIARGVTDAQDCASVHVERSGSYVFQAQAEEVEENATHRWWSNAVTQFYDGDPPGFVEIRLSNYARYARN